MKLTPCQKVPQHSQGVETDIEVMGLRRQPDSEDSPLLNNDNMRGMMGGVKEQLLVYELVKPPYDGINPRDRDSRSQNASLYSAIQVYRYAISRNGTVYVAHGPDIDNLDSVIFPGGLSPCYHDIVLSNLYAFREENNITNPAQKPRLIGFSDVKDGETIEALEEVFRNWPSSYDKHPRTDLNMVRSDLFAFFFFPSSSLI